MRKRVLYRCALSAGALLAGVGDAARAGEPLSFSDEALARGINFTIGFNYIQYGAGLALSDLDSDGDLDVLVANGPGGSFGIYENDGTGHFIDRRAGSGMTSMSVASGVAIADYDNDGDLDVFVSGWYTSSRLYRNNGGFNFTDVAVQAGIADPACPNMSPCWGDVDQDGDLDLYISVRTGTNAYTGGNLLYINNGDGTFSDEAIARGVDAGPDPTLVSTFFDFDRDGDDDLYLGTDKGSGGVWKNRMFRNDAGLFTEVTEAINAQAYVDCMGIAVGDLNFDGFYDLYLTNTVPGNKLLMFNPATHAYEDLTAGSGVGSYLISWSALFADFDNDTQLDIYVCNTRAQGSSNAPNRLYRGSQTWPLVDEAASAGVGELSDVYCAAEGDVDGDGDIDLLVGDTNGRVHLYINNSPDAATNNWVRFNVVGNQGNKNMYAVGTCVDITHDGKSQVRQVRSGTNYKSHSEYTLHFGLGSSESVDEIDLIFPGSAVRHLSNAPANQTWTLYPPSRLGDPNGNGRIDSFELYTALMSRTGAGNPITPGLEIYDMDGDFDLDNDDITLMELGIRTPSVKNLGVGP
ncbi:MAG: CRTAC1 family protein [Phycisphaerales bacterium]